MAEEIAYILYITESRKSLVFNRLYNHILI